MGSEVTLSGSRGAYVGSVGRVGGALRISVARGFVDDDADEAALSRSSTGSGDEVAALLTLRIIVSKALLPVGVGVPSCSVDELAAPFATPFTFDEDAAAARDPDEGVDTSVFFGFFLLLTEAESGEEGGALALLV